MDDRIATEIGPDEPDRPGIVLDAIRSDGAWTRGPFATLIDRLLGVLVDAWRLVR